ncbi:hypothetical protein CL616_01110 [archaeon]|nr:hypothetical protein [archaeon]
MFKRLISLFKSKKSAKKHEELYSSINQMSKEVIFEIKELKKNYKNLILNNPFPGRVTLAKIEFFDEMLIPQLKEIKTIMENKFLSEKKSQETAEELIELKRIEKFLLEIKLQLNNIKNIPSNQTILKTSSQLDQIIKEIIKICQNFHTDEISRKIIKKGIKEKLLKTISNIYEKTKKVKIKNQEIWECEVTSKELNQIERASKTLIASPSQGFKVKLQKWWREKQIFEQDVGKLSPHINVTLKIPHKPRKNIHLIEMT